MKTVLTAFIGILLINNLFAQDTIVIKTDSSLIKEIHFRRPGKLVEEFFKERNLVRKIYYYENDSTVHFDYYMDSSSHHCVGLQRTYDKEGNLQYTIDNDNNEWQRSDYSKYPYYKLSERIKHKSDSLIKVFYCDSFFHQHVRWSIGMSLYFVGDDWQSWVDPISTKPDAFKISYNLFYDSKNMRDEINLLFDFNGNLLLSYSNQFGKTNHLGIENLENSTSRNLNLIPQQAIKLATQLGLSETDSTKVWSYLRWEPIQDTTPQLFNGHFRVYVIQETNSEIIKHKKREHRYERIQHYNVWIFNPWSGEFVEKKTMHINLSGAGFVLFSSGLIDD